MADNDDGRSEALEWLQEAVGERADFRDGQWEAVDAVVNRRRRLLVVQATGWGKSIVYFLSARLLRMRGEGLTVIVSPLISLMYNQIAQAERMGVNAVTINFSNSDEWQEHYEAIKNTDADAVLISPERLANQEFIDVVRTNRVALLVVDEAHCISVWGHDFRPDYRRLPDIVRMFPDVRVLCTTATATLKVVDDIRKQFGVDVDVQRGSLLRSSLALQNIRLPDAAARLAWLAENVPRLPGSGIVYVLRRPDADQIADWLASRGVAARAYYAGVTASTDREDEARFVDDSDGYRRYLEELLLKNRVKVLVATIALGMGFDKPDIGFVVHYQRPGSVIAYYQQVGRAGRAIPRSVGILMAGDEDDGVHEHFRAGAFPKQDEMMDILRELADSGCGLDEEEIEMRCNLRSREIVQALRHMAADGTNSPVVKVDAKWQVRHPTDWRNYRLDTDHIDRVTEQRISEWDEMEAYFETETCLMTALRRFLQDRTLTGPSERCGRCAPCSGGPIVPTGFDRDLSVRSVSFLKTSKKTFICKTEAPKLYSFGRSLLPREIPRGLQAEEGRVLSYWMDAGWGMEIHDQKKANEFGDNLVDALADMIQKRWKPWPPKKNYGWVTCVPSTRHQKLVPDFAFRLAKRLRLPFRRVVVKVEDHEPQKSQRNNFHRCLNLDGTFKVKEQEELYRGPVLLVDDIVRSTWTVTVIAALLRQAGSGPVFPVALARIGTED